jgi:signal transduction histidine kinase/CheY-like chemotaxis protein
MKSLFLLITSIILIAHCAFSQKQGQDRIDSLLNHLPKTKEDTSKVNLLNDLCITCYTINGDNGIRYGNQALELAKKIQWNTGMAKAYNSIGINYHYAKTDYTKALDYYLKALKIFEESGNKKNIAISFIDIGNIYLRLSEPAKASDYYNKSLKICRESGDKMIMQKVLLRIGSLYNKQSDSTKAMDYYHKSLKINEELGNKSGLAKVYIAFGDLYRRNRSGYPKAYNYYALALKNDELAGNKSEAAYDNEYIGDLYRQQRKYSKALEYLFKGLEIHIELNDQKAIIYTYGVISYTYFLMATDDNRAELNKMFAGNKSAAMRKAVMYVERAIKLEKEIGDLFQLADSYISISQAWEQIGDYKGSLEYYKKYIAVRDSIFNVEKNKKLNELSMKFEFDKKQTADSLQHANENHLNKLTIQKQKAYTYMGFLGMGLIAAMLFFVFRNFNNQRKSNLRLQAAHNEIIAQKERAEQSEKFKQQFLANMSHEIRTPMNAVMGMTNLLIDKNPRTDQQNYLDGIKKSSDILLHIINEILDLSKIESGKMELEKIDFSLHSTVEQVLVTLNHKADEKGLVLHCHIDKNIPDVLVGDPVRINQVLMNLAGNAIKFTEKGSVQIKICLVDNEPASVFNLQFSITDTGIGIPKEKLETVFESFSQANTSDTRKHGGTGLGLTISRQLVELHGGTITIESEEGAGTVFSFILGFEEGSAERLQQQINSTENIDGSILNGLKILVADDNEYNRIVANDTLLSKSDVSIQLVSSGMEAIEALKSNDFDLILMDVQMPEMNGFEATKYIRENFALPKKDIPIIALTASVLRTDLDKCRLAGMNSHIPKPFNASQLIGGIAEVMGIKIRTIQKTYKKEEKQTSGNGVITNLTYLENFCEGDIIKMKKYISIFADSAPALIEKLNKAIAATDMVAIADQVHGFKTKFMMMGMNKAKEIANKIELSCRDGANYEDVKTNIEKLILLVETGMNELKSTHND